VSVHFLIAFELGGPLGIGIENELTPIFHSQIRRAKKDEQALRAYAALQEAVEFLGRIRILSLDEQALRRFHELRTAKHRPGTNDLKIAAIVQCHAATLVSRNLRDFKRVPGLRLEKRRKGVGSR
jgi:tRNA(fMet)-specific endonuclease VapC